MADTYVSTHWHVSNGRENEFVEMWREALTWTKQTYGNELEHARLLRDQEDPSHLVSFIEFAGSDAVDRWSDDPEKQRRQRELEELCGEAQGSVYDEATRVG